MPINAVTKFPIKTLEDLINYSKIAIPAKLQKVLYDIEDKARDLRGCGDLGVVGFQKFLLNFDENLESSLEDCAQFTDWVLKSTIQIYLGENSEYYAGVPLLDTAMLVDKFYGSQSSEEDLLILIEEIIDAKNRYDGNFKETAVIMGEL